MRTTAVADNIAREVFRTATAMRTTVATEETKKERHRHELESSEQGRNLSLRRSLNIGTAETIYYTPRSSKCASGSGPRRLDFDYVRFLRLYDKY